MDVADLSVQPPESNWAHVFGSASISLCLITIGFAVSAAVAAGKRQRARRSVIAALVGSLAVASVISGASADTGYRAPNYAKVIESGLFDNYGFTAPTLTWSQIQNSGSNGYITTMKRDGDEFTVKVTLEGTRLSLVGTDGQEIPAHNQRTESSK